MNNKQLVTSIAEFAAAKNIDHPTVIRMLRDVLQVLITRKFGEHNSFDIIIDPKKGDLQIWRTRTVIPDPADASHPIPPNQIPLSQAQAIEADFVVGEEVVDEVGLELFGRRAVMDALQLFIRKKDLLEKDQLYEHYNRLIGKVIDVEVGYSKPNITILYDDDKNEILLPRKNQIPKERFYKNTMIKVLVEHVENERGKVHVIASRVSPLFLKELLTQEIPEIADNIVIINSLVRMPGIRSKVVVESQDDRIDAAGACIGRNARRIQTISKEHLNSERVDIITNTDNMNLLIKRIAALNAPIQTEEDEQSITIRIRPEQMPVLHQNKPFLQEMLGKEIFITTHAGANAETASTAS